MANVCQTLCQAYGAPKLTKTQSLLFSFMGVVEMEADSCGQTTHLQGLLDKRAGEV